MMEHRCGITPLQQEVAQHVEVLQNQGADLAPIEYIKRWKWVTITSPFTKQELLSCSLFLSLQGVYENDF